MADQPGSASKLGIASVVLQAMLSASVRLWTSPFKGRKGAPTYFKDVMYAMMRTQLGKLNLAQDRAMSPPTSAVYEQFAKAAGFAPDSIALPDGTLAHWIGNKNAAKLIVYFHGGGYVVSANLGQMQFMSDMKDALIAQGTDAAVIVLAYSVAPEHKYPTQLTQAVELLRYLVETQGRNPSDITLVGDSAGGNLAIGLLSHLSHPHPHIAPLPLPSKLHAALLISPWCSFNTHTPAFETNAESDCFDSRSLSRWSTAFLGSDSPFAGDFYSEPVLAPHSWWEKTADVIEEVLVWGGGGEILLDGIEEFGKRFQKGFGGRGGRASVIVTPRAAHIEPILEKLLGYKGDSGTGSAGVLQEWARAKL